MNAKLVKYLQTECTNEYWNGQIPLPESISRYTIIRLSILRSINNRIDIDQIRSAAAAAATV